MEPALASSAGRVMTAASSHALLIALSTECVNKMLLACATRAGQELDVRHPCVRVVAMDREPVQTTAHVSVMLDSKATTAQYLPTAANVDRASVDSASAELAILAKCVRTIVAVTAACIRMGILINPFRCALDMACAQITGVSARRASLVETAPS